MTASADQIVEINYQKGKQTVSGRVHGKGHEPPYLTAEDRRRAEGEIAHKHGIDRPYEPESDVAYADVFHQIGNTEPRVLSAEAVNEIQRFAHIVFS